MLFQLEDVASTNTADSSNESPASAVDAAFLSTVLFKMSDTAAHRGGLGYFSNG